MPVYQCITQPELLTADKRAEVAGEITRIHCETTGAPAAFVNVLFLDAPDGRLFTAGRPSSHSVIVGDIRHGRDVATRQELLSALSTMWTGITGQPEGELIVGLREIPSENAMEAGLIFPAPGEEQAWLKANRERLTELGLN
jgi:phenylpyruvate tautomerase PptA (4-oxalocrotonate tautomerase family)